jgi:hypothetical protein
VRGVSPEAVDPWMSCKIRATHDIRLTIKLR